MKASNTRIKTPAPSTLKRYGLSLDDWNSLLIRADHACEVCRRVPNTGRLVIDHEHVAGWRKLKPYDRQLFVRGLLCNRCNWQYLRRGMTAKIASGMFEYLARYEEDKHGQDT